MTGPVALGPAAATAAAAAGLLVAVLAAPVDGGGSASPAASVAGPAASVAGPAVGTRLVGDASVPVSRRWQWPLRPRPTVLRPFVAPVSTYAAGHRGLDLTAPAGVVVLAVEAGVVVHAGVVAGRGTVSVEHADGLRSTYEPVTALVRTGDVVAAGDQLGRIAPPRGAAHCGPTSCLHLGARRGGTYLDPLPLLAGGRVILLPLG